MLNELLRHELLDMQARDSRALNDALTKHGFEIWPRSPETDRHGHIVDDNTRRLAAIVSQNGWPGVPLVGDDGSIAALTLALHTDDLNLQSRCRELVRLAIHQGHAPPRHMAFLEDRVRCRQGRPQVYGTQFDWSGSIAEIEDPDNVNMRRKSVGLEPLPVKSHVRMNGK